MKVVVDDEGTDVNLCRLNEPLYHISTCLSSLSTTLKSFTRRSAEAKKWLNMGEKVVYNWDMRDFISRVKATIMTSISDLRDLELKRDLKRGEAFQSLVSESSDALQSPTCESGDLLQSVVPEMPRDNLQSLTVESGDTHQSLAGDNLPSLTVESGGVR